MGEAIVKVTVLPARAAYLIREGSKSGLRRSVQEASTRWGGGSEIIIPISEDGSVAPSWVDVIELSRVNGLINVDLDDEQVERVTAQVGRDVLPLKYIDRFGPAMFTTHPSVVFAAPTSGHVAQMARAASELWEVVAIGDMTEEHSSELAAGVDGFAVGRVRAGADVGYAQLRGISLLDTTLSQFGERFAGPAPAPAVLWLTTPDSFDDCLYFWNLRALRPIRQQSVPMLLIPDPGIDNWTDFRTQLSGWLTRPCDVEPDVVVHSFSVDLDRCAEILERLGLVRSTEEPHRRHRWPPPPMRLAPHTYLTDIDPAQFVGATRAYGLTSVLLMHLYEHGATLRVDSPVAFRGSGYAMLRVESAVLDAIPRRKRLAPLVMNNAYWDGDAIGVNTNAVHTYHFDLRVPTQSDVVWELLREATEEASLSDKGKLGARLEQLSLGELLLQPNAVHIIRTLTTPRSKELLKELKKLSSIDREAIERLAAFWGGRTSRSYKSIDDLGLERSEASQVAEALVKVGGGDRGVEVRCDRCSIRSFVPLQETTPQPLCPECGVEQRYELRDGVRLCYRLNALVDRAADQGIIPHLLALAVLTAADSRSYLLPGVNLRFSDGHEAEVDLFGVHKAKVIAGEAKVSGARFSEVARDVELSIRLQADYHLMACPEQIAQESIDEVTELTTRAGIGLMVLEGTSLRTLAEP